MKTEDIEHLASEYSQQDWNRLEYAKIYREGFIAGANEVNAEVEQLQQRNAELEAQVEQSEAAKIHTARVSFRAGALRFGANLYLASEAADKYIEAMPTQCLAEHDREVAARAVLALADDLFDSATVGAKSIRVVVKEYANKIKSGEVEI